MNTAQIEQALEKWLKVHSANAHTNFKNRAEEKANLIHDEVIGYQACLRDFLKCRKDYEELLYAVGSKYPNETRHKTALRYIREHEASANCGSAKQVGGGK